MSLPRIAARVICNKPIQELWGRLQGDFIIVFEDGKEFQTNERVVLVSHYVWRFHREFPGFPLLGRHFLPEVMGKKMYNTSTHIKLIERVVWDAYRFLNPAREQKDPLLDRLKKICYEIANDLWNGTTLELEEWVLGLDILDFDEIDRDPMVTEAKNNPEDTVEAVANVDQVIRDRINTPGMFPDNSLAFVMRAGLTRESQALQCLGWRGFTKDLDSKPFDKPIKRGFYDGITELAPSMMESRSATISLVNSTEPLEKSEYFSRRQQLICMNVRNLHRVDCGSTHYMSWRLRPAQFTELQEVVDGELITHRTQVMASDLVTFEGKYYLDEEAKALRVLTRTDKHLEGKVLKFRSVIGGCNHSDSYGVCEVCYGTLGDSIPAGANLGHINCVTLTSKMGQDLLSTKHFLGSASVEGIVLNPQYKRFLQAAINGNKYSFNPNIAKRKPILEVSQGEFSGVTTLGLVPKVETLNVVRVSEIELIALRFPTADGGFEREVMEVEVNGCKSSFNHQMLEYIKRHGFTVDTQNPNQNYLIDLKDWDFTQPFMVLPMRQAGTSDHQGEIAKLLEATVKDLEERSERVDPVAMLAEFHDLVNRKFEANVAILEIILYSSMVQSAVRMNYALPKGYTPMGLGVMRKLLSSRSVGATMAFQGHRDVLTDPAQYIHTNRPDHPMDGVLMPEELFAPNAYYDAKLPF